MNKLRSSSKKGMLVLVMVMSMIIPNLTVYSAVGEYSTESSALHANSTYDVNGNVAAAAWPLAVAGAVATVYIAGRVVGTVAHHAHHLIGGHKYEGTVDDNYTAKNFSKFDN